MASSTLSSSSSSFLTSGAAGDEELRVAIFVLKSLGAGKAVSQACHAVHQMTMRLEQEYFQTPFPITPRCLLYKEWCEKPTKIVLAATAEQLMALASREHESIPILDEEGDEHNHLPPGTLVCVALLPMRSQESRELTKLYKLL